MNSSERLTHVKKKIKSLGLTKPGKSRTLKCIKCGESVLVHMNDPEIYTPEVIAQWKCYQCSMASKKGGEMKVKKVVTIIPTPVVAQVAKTLVSKVAKGSKVSVAETWVRILSSHVNKKTLDKAIAAEMTKACPGHKVYTEGDVCRHRSIYNTGKFPSQKNIVPKVTLERYVA